MSTNTNTFDPAALQGVDVVGSDDEKLGTVQAVYLDNATSHPEWAAVKSGLFGNHVSMVPLATAQFDGEHLTVPYDKDELKDAPHHDPDGDLTPQAEQDLYRHYGVGGGHQDSAGPYVAQAEPHDDQAVPHPVADTADTSDTADTADATDAPRGHGPESVGTQGHDTSGPNTDDAMTRSEERLDVGTQRRESGRARLRKYVVTEEEQHSVPVSHEEVRVEREPITEQTRDEALSGGDITEEEHEVTLHEQVPVIRTETVPVERIRLGTEEVEGEEQVSGQVRKEVVDDPETDTTTGRRGPDERGSEDH